MAMCLLIQFFFYYLNFNILFDHSCISNRYKIWTKFCSNTFYVGDIGLFQEVVYFSGYYRQIARWSIS